ncbi:MAG: 4Fe-4S binding protein [Bacillota bacterium]|nr:4Fe-4S binding protein [Bacillota bacterium]
MGRENKVLKVNPSWCKGCGICVHFCPKNVLELDEDNKIVIARGDDCIKCGLCELRCPDFAIYLEGDKDEK